PAAPRSSGLPARAPEIVLQQDGRRGAVDGLPRRLRADPPPRLIRCQGLLVESNRQARAPLELSRERPDAGREGALDALGRARDSEYREADFLLAAETRELLDRRAVALALEGGSRRRETPGRVRGREPDSYLPE